MRHDIIVQSMSCLNCYGNVIRLVFTKIAAQPVCTCFADKLLNLNSNGCTVNLTKSSYCISSGCFALYKGGSYHVQNEPSLPVEEEQRMTSCIFKMSSLPVEGQQRMRSFSFAGICCFLHLTSSFFYFNCVDFPTICRLICMQGLFWNDKFDNCKIHESELWKLSQIVLKSNGCPIYCIRNINLLGFLTLLPFQLLRKLVHFIIQCYGWIVLVVWPSFKNDGKSFL